MNEIKNPTKILNILISLLTFLILTKGEIFDNPYSITKNANPIKVKGSNGYYYILTSGKSFVLDSTGKIIVNNTFETYSSPYTWINDESNNNYIFAKDKYIQVTFNEETISYNVIEKPTWEYMEYPDSSVHIGSMAETSTGALDSCLCSIEENEVIIYGKKGSSSLVLTFLKKKVSYTFDNIGDNIEDKIDCKIFQKGYYFCAFTSLNSVKVLFFSHIIYGGICGLTSGILNPLKTHTYVQLFDYDNQKYLICAKSVNSNNNNINIECQSFGLKKNNECSVPSVINRTPILNFTTSSEINQDLILNHFGGENLYCYGEIGFIKCYRVAARTNYIVNTFTLEIPGSNSKLSFFTDGKTYGNFIFYNNNLGRTNLYEYFIYLPSCQNLVYSIIIYHSISEDKKVDLKLFERKTNTKYYIEFETLPDDYGDLKVNNETILGENSKILLENEQSFLDFVSTNNKTVTNFTIPYKILIN